MRERYLRHLRCVCSDVEQLTEPFVADKVLTTLLMYNLFDKLYYVGSHHLIHQYLELRWLRLLFHIMQLCVRRLKEQTV